MPPMQNFKKILLIGSGPIVIGQACEFDYSSSIALKTLKSLGYEVVLLNSNPITINTDKALAYKTYIEPINTQNVLKIVDKEGIEAILPTMGGQTALNIMVELHQQGHFEGALKNVRLLGAKIESILKAEDRRAFKECMLGIGLDLPKGGYAYSEEEALGVVKEVGFPCIIRSSFTLGGEGSSVAFNIEEFRDLAKFALEASPISEILIEESLLGCKEFEMEVVRDCKDNCVIVCCIENVDPMGIHTGDSITIAPALTLTDKEYQRMRDASFAVLRAVGVDTGGANVQFAIKDRRLLVIEMNPRVSRSSALASKATLFPIAKVATLLALGHTLEEIQNDITQSTTCFEPTLDYIITKIPHFDFEKFPQVDTTLGTSMKSIGEVMGIGGSFKESLMKALESDYLLKNLRPFLEQPLELEFLKKELRRPNPKRLLYAMHAFSDGLSVDEVNALCYIDPYFLNEIAEIVQALLELKGTEAKTLLGDKNALFGLKSMGLSDALIASFLGVSELKVRQARDALDLHPKMYQVDLSANEFKSPTPYLYSTYAPPFPTLQKPFKSTRQKVILIGSSANKIGVGMEFDYALTHASLALKKLGLSPIIINNNPETISTDHDTSDTLYFEPITLEHVLEIVAREREHLLGVVVGFGGQTPLKIAKDLEALGIPLLGTAFKDIEIAEERDLCHQLLDHLNIAYPKGLCANSKVDALEYLGQLELPLILRPSFVLGGAKMRILRSKQECLDYIESYNFETSLLMDNFLEDALELDVDAICDQKSVFVCSVLEHIEPAGIHSGDSTCFIPPNLSPELLDDLYYQTQKIALGLQVLGLVNIQFAYKNNQLVVLEINPRASRTVPFVSKALGLDIAAMAIGVMVGQSLENLAKEFALVHKAEHLFIPQDLNYVFVKESVFPFNKLYGADLVLGPEMKSTGEVAGVGYTLAEAFYKSQLACNNPVKLSGNLFVSLKDSDKQRAMPLMRAFVSLGFKLYATTGTHKALQAEGLESVQVLKISEGRPNISDFMLNHEIDMAINTSDRLNEDSKIIRMQVLKNKISYFTTLKATEKVLLSLLEYSKFKDSPPVSLQELQKETLVY
ncbi:carbamoyl-phosphate synthase large subunit [Helicobacter salomonis]|uniref:carbamoyl-phosphate synthase large subunit n=1 Tax=Helicobacter salomonis TaxID=56878 RepID=UPI003988F0EA